MTLIWSMRFMRSDPGRQPPPACLEHVDRRSKRYRRRSKECDDEPECRGLERQANPTMMVAVSMVPL